MIKQVINSVLKLNLAFVLAFCIMVVGIFSEIQSNDEKCASVEKVLSVKNNIVATTKYVVIPVAEWMAKDNTTIKVIKFIILNKEEE